MGYEKHKKKKTTKAVIYDGLNDGQLYGKVIKILGCMRYTILCNDGIERLGKTCNKMNRIKDKRMVVDEYVIVSMRECDTRDRKCDILGYADPPKDVIKSWGTKEEFDDETLFMTDKPKVEEGADEEFNIDDI
jgi:initiation factor 1A